MSAGLNRLQSPVLQALILAGLTVIVLFYWQGHAGFNLGDEGYLWYGVQRVMQGEVPLRDFMSYDPGRYYWSAMLLSFWGKQDIMALRASVAIFEVLGLFVGLWLIARSQKRQSLLYLTLCAFILAAWMFPFFKVFDVVTSIFLIGILTILIENPKKSIYFLTGVCLGLFAVMGRNHGVYGLVSSLSVIVWLQVKKDRGCNLLTGLTFGAIGIVLGFTPILLMMLFMPGFAAAFWESNRFLLEMKATNLPLPTPWPWTIPFTHSLQFLNNFAIGMFFIAILVFGVLALIGVFWQKWHHKAPPAALVAAALTALPYVHYAYSRADSTHLAQGIFPLLIGCLVFFSNLTPKIKWFLAIGLGLASFLAIGVLQPGWKCRKNACVDVEISGDVLQIDPGTANNIHLLQQLVTKYAPGDTSFVVTPFWPSGYALFNRKSPLWEIYALFPRPIAFQEAEIEAIQKTHPGFIFILDVPLDGRDDLRFENTHPIVYRYIVNHFDLNQNFSDENGLSIYIPKSSKE